MQTFLRDYQSGVEDEFYRIISGAKKYSLDSPFEGLSFKHKINLIKKWRECFGSGLKDAKESVESIYDRVKSEGLGERREFLNI